MKETTKNQGNDLHLYGYINGVRMNEVSEGRVAVTISVATIENFKQGEENKSRRTFHNAVLFTSDKDLIAKFEAIKAATDKNRENQGVEGFKPETHTISLDGFLVKRENSFGEDGQKYDSAQIMVKEDSVDLDVKQAENEVRNSARLSGNIGSIRIVEDKDFADLSIIHHYTSKDGRENELPIHVRVNGNRRDGKQVLEDLKAGKIKVGDFIRIGGQLRQNNYEKEGEGKRYGLAVDMTTFKMLKQKEAVAVKEEVKTAPKAAPKAQKAPAQKPQKKATSRKKMSM